MRSRDKSRFDTTDSELADFFDSGTVLVRNPRFRLLGFLLGAIIAGVAVGVVAAPAAFAVSAGVDTAITAWEKLPEELPLDQPLPEHIILLDKDGQEFARFVTENRVSVEREQISESFVDALIGTEDRSFFDHNGIDFKGLTRATISNVAGGATQGASTITQQYVQNLLIANARDETEQMVASGTTIQAKIQEARYTIWVEDQLTKDEILTRYANAVYMGNLAYGVEAAARTYFNVSAAELNVQQSALLVAMLKAPSLYDPFVHPEAALDRRNLVIENMVVTESLSRADADVAKASELGLNRGTVSSGCGESAYPHFCSMVQEQILTDAAFGATDADRQEAFRRGGLTITTTLDRAATDAAQRSAVQALSPDNRVGTGIAVVEPGTGHVSAIAQNHDWARTQVVFATSRMQPGSVMKPIVLAAALDSGFDVNTRFPSNGPYTPSGGDAPSGGFSNFGGEQPGTIDAATATKRSINVYYIKVAEAVGVKRIAQVARSMGLEGIPTDLTGRELSIALGTYETSPLEIAGAYATLAAGGIHCDPTTVISIVDTDTGVIEPTPDTNCNQVISSSAASQMTDVLQGAFNGGTLTGVGKLPGRVAGGKTGTTDDSAAVWTAGITPQFATAVWVGDPRGGQQYPLTNITAFGRHVSLGLGSSLAGPIWRNVMVGIHAGYPAVDFGAAGQVRFPSDTRQRVPNVVGMDIEAAITALTGAGLVATIDPVSAGDDRYQANAVTAQSLAAGTAIPADRTISLTLSPGSETDVDITQN